MDNISEVKKILNDSSNLANLMLKYSKNNKELDNIYVNYHPQNIDNYYQDVLPTKLTIAEFVLDDNVKQKIENDLKQIVEYFKDNKFSFGGRENLVKIWDGEKEKKEIDELIKDIMKGIPTKAFIIKSDNVSMVLNQYDKIKEELKNIDGNDLVFKPKNVMYDALATIYNIEKNIKKVNNYAQEEFIKPFNVDLYGISKKDFVENAFFNSVLNKIILGTFFNLESKSVVNASNDTDVVIHELGHKLLYDLKPSYSYNQNHPNYSETRVVHEAFGDINAFLYAASDPNIEKYIKDNNIDLSKTNLISKIAEYLGKNVVTNKKIMEKLLLENPYASKEELKNINNEELLDDLAEDFKYKKYSELKEEEREVHLQSKSLSNAVYKAFVSFYINNKEKYGLNEVADKFYNVLIKGAKISNPAATTIPEFMKSIIIADILFNNSELSEYLLKAANENNILKKSNLKTILREIKESREVNIEPIKEVLKGKEIKELEKVVKEDKEFEKKIKEACLKVLKKYSIHFGYLTTDMLSVSLVPGFNNGLNIEITYLREMFFNSSNGIIFVLDNEMNLIYSYIEKPEG